MSTEADTSTAGGWESLDREKQDAILSEQMEEADLTPEGSFDFEEQEPGEAQSAADLLQGKVEETWFATVLEDVTLEFYELRDKDVSKLQSWAGLFAQVSQAEDVEDLEQETLDQLEQIDGDLEQLLEDVTVDESLDKEWWAEGDYPDNLKMEIFHALRQRHEKHQEQIKN